MMLDFFFVLCFTGFVPVEVFVQTVPHKYELIMYDVSWSDAQDYCSVKYTGLAVILSDTDWLRVSYVAENYVAWVGLYNDIDSWRWSLNDLPLTYTHWRDGEPNNGYGKESCVSVTGNGQWIDEDCKLAKSFICYNDTTSGSKFIAYSIKLPWLGAQEFCRNHFTDLAIAMDTADTNTLTYLWNLVGDAWIGLYRDTWKWSYETNATNLRWAPTQPDNSAGDENCALIYNGLLYDERCTKLYYFFCYTESPMRGQIMRLQLMSDDSVLDPEVQAFILEKIEKELKANGALENVTVKWKVWPDGMIFKKKKK